MGAVTCLDAALIESTPLEEKRSSGKKKTKSVALIRLGSSQQTE
jgi:hypothetical protein